eukprot:COSAG04_NODE_630_length_11765_cov_6.900394_3_plen_149_part_00
MAPPIAVVSGGSRGLGLAVCRALASDGHRVAVLSSPASGPCDLRCHVCCLRTQSPPSATDMRPLINTPAYIFHGARDGGAVGSLTAHAALTTAAEEAGVPSRVRLAIYPQTDDRHHSRSSFHDSWTQTYEFTGLYDWLLEQRRGAPRL